MSKGTVKRYSNKGTSKALSELERAGVKFRGFNHRNHRTNKRWNKSGEHRRERLDQINNKEIKKQINELKY